MSTKNLNQVHINGSAGSTRLTGDACTPNTIHYTFDNFALANGPGAPSSPPAATPGSSSPPTTRSATTSSRRPARVVKAKGGKVLGAVRVPLNNADFSSFLLQAQSSKAKVVGLANAGGDTINAIKQAAEFGLVQRGQRLAGMLMFITDVHSLGLEAAQGLTYTDSFYWNRNADTRAWTQRFNEKIKGRQYPTMNHAGNYSGMLHYLKAVEAAADARR